MAKQRGYSLYRTVNEIFELALRAEAAGLNLRRVVEEMEILKEAREAGFILTLENLWYEMVELAYRKAENESLKRWFEAGVWFAKRYVGAREVEDPFEAFKRGLEAFAWHLDLTVKKKKSEVSVLIINPRFTESYTLLFEAFLEGALKTFGYRVSSKEVSRGIIRLDARKGADE